MIRNKNVLMLQAMGIKNPVLYLAAIVTAIIFVIMGMIAQFFAGIAALMLTGFGFGILAGLMMGYAILT